MPDSLDKNIVVLDRQPTRIVMLLAILWTVIIAGSLIWSIKNEQNHIDGMAVREARSNFDKDQAFRLWATGHGGVYVKPDSTTPPNPYLAHVPNRDQVTTDGMNLTLMNPAYMVRQLNEQYSRIYGIHGDITSLKPLRPENAPDEWQKKALFALENGSTEEREYTEIDGDKYLRLMKPMMTQDGCLKCHGQQGYKAGDIRGGVSVSVPMASYNKLLSEYYQKVSVAHVLLWLAGLIGLGIVLLRLANNIQMFNNVNTSLKISKKQYENAMLASNDGMFELNLKEMSVRYNDRWFTMLGYGADELPVAYTTWKNLLPLDEADKIEREVMALAFERERWSYEFRMLSKTGDWIWILVRGYCAEKDENGKHLVVVGTHTDITERKLSESMLAARLRLTTMAETCSLSELLQAFLDEAEVLTYSNIGFFHYLEDNNTVSLQMWSTNTLNNMCSMDGTGMKYQLVHAGIWADCARQGQVVVHNDYPSMPNKKGLPKGHAPVLREIVVPIFRNNKMVAFFGLGNKKTNYQESDIRIVQELSGMAWDIVERKQAQLELEKYREHLEELVRKRTEELNEKNINLEQAVTRLNETQSQLILFEKMTALRHLVSGIAHEINNPLGAIESSRELITTDIKRLVDNITNIARWLTGPEGELLSELLSRADRQENLDMVLSSQEKRQTRFDMVKLLAENNVVQAEDVAAVLTELHVTDNIERLLPLLRHADILEKLRVIGYVLDSQIACGTIQTAVDKASKIVNALGSYVRKDGESQSKMLADLKNGINNVLLLFQNTFKNFVTLELDIASDLPQIMCYPDQLNQVWTNVIQNALYAMKNTGKLVIRAKCRDNGVEVSIIDQGCGMTPEVQARIFEPLFTTKPAGEGIGLGMDIVHMIVVERHNGRIDIQSQPGVGTTVAIWLPVQSEQIADGSQAG